MKARSVVFAPEAKDDLIDLFDYIASVASPDIALSFLDRIEGFCNNMDVGSERGLRRDDIRPGLYQSQLIRTYLMERKFVSGQAMRAARPLRPGKRSNNAGDGFSPTKGALFLSCGQRHAF